MLKGYMECIENGCTSPAGIGSGRPDVLVIVIPEACCPVKTKKLALDVVNE